MVVQEKEAMSLILSPLKSLIVLEIFLVFKASSYIILTNLIVDNIFSINNSILIFVLITSAP